MYLIVIGFLALVLTLTGPVVPLIGGLWATLLALGTAVLLPPLVGAIVTRRVLRRLELYPERPSRAQVTFGRGMFTAQLVLAGVQFAILLCSDWIPLTRRVPVVGEWPVIPGLITIAPFMLSIVLLWLLTYPADRAVRQIALEVYLVRGRPPRPVWPVLEYLAYNLRHQVLFVLAPMLLILAAADLTTIYRDPIARRIGLDFAPDLLVGLTALLVAVLAPEILRHVWITQRLPDGPLRDRLQQLARTLRLRYRDILVWRSGGMVVNAAVMGLIPPVRYVLITDAMLEQMDDLRIEAVFGHEAGHVKRHHLLFFLMFAFLSGCLATVASIHMSQLTKLVRQDAAFLLIGGVFLFKWTVLFGWISRRFERQADLSGVRALTLSGLPCGQPCLVHAPVGVAIGDCGLDTAKNGNPQPLIAMPATEFQQANSSQAAIGAPRGAVCTTAAAVFSDALNEVAILNGIRPEARSWRHSSIASRSRFLQQLARAPACVQRFERTVGLVKTGIFIAAAAGAIWAAYDMQIWEYVRVHLL